MKQILLAVQMFTVGLLALPLQAQLSNQGPEISSMSRHPIKRVEANGLNYAYIEKGQGPVIIFLHGFPDLANCWDACIEDLSSEYRCIAPFLRGYYPTDLAEDGDYAPKTIAKDIGELATALGIDKFYLVGQDWGASTAYAAANLFPNRIVKLVTIAIPHPTYIRTSARTLYKARHFLSFRKEEKSLKKTSKNNFAYLDVLYKRWSPNWLEYEETSKLIKQTFQIPGRLEAALGYYWTFNQNLGDKALSDFYAQMPEMPLLTIAGKTDRAVVMRQFKMMEKKIDPSLFKLLIHPKAGHFLQSEQPEFLSRALLAFFSN